MVILEHFGEDAYGCDLHGHNSKSKETLYKMVHFYNMGFHALCTAKIRVHNIIVVLSQNTDPNMVF
jgi:hypothetical protein